jgi:hypothetical protein
VKTALYSLTAPLIHQSPVQISIPPGGTPLLPVNMPSDEEAELRVVIAINFLRCGCPEVQFLLPYSPTPANARFTKLMAILKDAEMDGENFKFFRRKDRIFSLIRVHQEAAP